MFPVARFARKTRVRIFIFFPLPPIVRAIFQFIQKPPGLDALDPA